MSDYRKWEKYIVPEKGNLLGRFVCKVLGHRWFKEMAPPPSNCGWLRCSRCRSRL